MQSEMYENLAELEEQEYWWFRGRAKITAYFFKRYFRLGTEKRILDVGCGMGGELEWLEKYGQVYATDIEPVAVEATKKRAHHPESIQIGALPDKINFGVDFDAVVAMDVLEHVAEDEASLRFIKTSLLKSGGLLLLTVPVFGWLWSPHDEVHMHMRRYTRPELRHKLESAGFTIQKISYFNTFLFPLAVMVKIFSKIFRRTPKAHFNKPLPGFINQLFYYIFLLEKYCLSFINFPYGVSLVVVAKTDSK